MTSIEFRFWSKVSFARGARGCWLWCGSHSVDGYGLFSLHSATRRAHVVGYHMYVGVMAPCLQLDHSVAAGCDNRNCVNFRDHLEEVTPQENIRRSTASAAHLSWWPIHQRAATHCARGHLFKETTNGRGWRECRVCAADRQRRFRARRALGYTYP